MDWINNLPDEDFKIITIKMLTKFGEEWMNTVENFNKEIEENTK